MQQSEKEEEGGKEVCLLFKVRGGVGGCESLRACTRGCVDDSQDDGVEEEEAFFPAR